MTSFLSGYNGVSMGYDVHLPSRKFCRQSDLISIVLKLSHDLIRLVTDDEIFDVPENVLLEVQRMSKKNEIL